MRNKAQLYLFQLNHIIIYIKKNFVNILHYIMLSACKSMIPHNMLSLYFITHFGKEWLRPTSLHILWRFIRGPVVAVAWQWYYKNPSGQVQKPCVSSSHNKCHVCYAISYTAGFARVEICKSCIFLMNAKRVWLLLTKDMYVDGNTDEHCLVVSALKAS